MVQAVDLPLSNASVRRRATAGAEPLTLRRMLIYSSVQSRIEDRDMEPEQNKIFNLKGLS